MLLKVSGQEIDITSYATIDAYDFKEIFLETTSIIKVMACDDNSNISYFSSVVGTSLNELCLVEMAGMKECHAIIVKAGSEKFCEAIGYRDLTDIDKITEVNMVGEPEPGEIQLAETRPTKSLLRKNNVTITSNTERGDTQIFSDDTSDVVEDDAGSMYVQKQYVNPPPPHI